MTAFEALAGALEDLAGERRTTPCQGRHRDRWTSDDSEDRAWAANTCVALSCPVTALCGTAAGELGEQANVWGGVDRTRLKNRGANNSVAPNTAAYLSEQSEDVTS